MHIFNFTDTNLLIRSWLIVDALRIPVALLRDGPILKPLRAALRLLLDPPPARLVSLVGLKAQVLIQLDSEDRPREEETREWNCPLMLMCQTPKSRSSHSVVAT